MNIDMLLKFSFSMSIETFSTPLYSLKLAWNELDQFRSIVLQYTDNMPCKCYLEIEAGLKQLYLVDDRLLSVL